MADRRSARATIIGAVSSGDLVELADEPGCIVPAGRYRVSSVNRDGSFHVGGNTAVWPRRISKRTSPAPGRRSAKSDSIRARMDVALEKAKARGAEPNAFYLTSADWDQYNAELSAEWGSPCHSFSYRDVEIRRGKTSRLYCWHGEGIAVPKRLSRRVVA